MKGRIAFRPRHDGDESTAALGLMVGELWVTPDPVSDGVEVVRGRRFQPSTKPTTRSLTQVGTEDRYVYCLNVGLVQAYVPSLGVSAQLEFYELHPETPL